MLLFECVLVGGSTVLSVVWTSVLWDVYCQKGGFEKQWTPIM